MFQDMDPEIQVVSNASMHAKPSTSSIKIQAPTITQKQGIMPNLQIMKKQSKLQITDHDEYQNNAANQTEIRNIRSHLSQRVQNENFYTNSGNVNQMSSNSIKQNKGQIFVKKTILNQFIKKGKIEVADKMKVVGQGKGSRYLGQVIDSKKGSLNNSPELVKGGDGLPLCDNNQKYINDFKINIENTNLSKIKRGRNLSKKLNAQSSFGDSIQKMKRVETEEHEDAVHPSPVR